MGHVRFGRRWTLWLVLITLAQVSGCSWSPDEPGLFGRETEPPSAAPPMTSTPTARSQQESDLPVVGEEVWTSADGLDVQVRIAIHGVRRTAGATVLDWSITPLRAPGLTDGDAVPEIVDLGLTRWGQHDLNVFLIDVPSHRVYRPLSSTQTATCLCSSLDVVQRQLRIGRTQLLQIAYPPVRSDTDSIDVDVSTVPIFAHVPVTHRGLIPTATSPTDLARPAESTPVTTTSRAFRYADGGQSLLVSVDAVTVSNTFTTVSWTIQSLTDGPGLQSATAPPLVAGEAVRRLTDPQSASGPRVLFRGRPAADLSFQQMTNEQGGAAARECLCTSFRTWASALRTAEQQASVVTNYPSLPIGAETVDVTFPGLDPLTGIRLTTASDGAGRSASPTPGTTRTYGPVHPPLIWALAQWPTPLPNTAALAQYQATVERLVS